MNNNNDNSSSVNAMLDRFGLNWKVERKELIAGDEVVPKYKALCRGNTIFSVMKNSYEVFQNSELCELILRLSEKTGFELSRGGSFSKGAKVYMQLKTNSYIGIGENNDKIDSYITAINSFDGSTSLRFGHTDVTISCKNTFNRASAQLQNCIRHTNNMRKLIDQALIEIERLNEVEKETISRIYRMSEIEISRDLLLDVVQRISGCDLSIGAEALKSKYSTYSIHSMEILMKSIEKEMSEKGETLWGLFSGVTHYTTHEKRSKNEDTRFASKMLGNAYSLDNEVFSMLQN